MTVLLPVRDGAATVGRAVASVLAQTFIDLELVVVDDASRDNTRAVLAAVDDPRLRVVVGPGRGIVDALRAGLAVAQGELVARMDADDTCAPDRLALQVASLDAHPEVTAVSSAFAVLEPDGGPRRVEPTLLDDGDLARELLVHNPFAHGATTIRRAALDAAGGYRHGWTGAEDYDLWRRLRAVGPLASVSSVLYEWRLGAADGTRASGAASSARRIRDELWAAGPPPVRDHHELRRRADVYAADPSLGPARRDHFLQVELALVVERARRGHRGLAMRQLVEVARLGGRGLVAVAVFAVSGGRVTSPRRLARAVAARVRRRGR